MLTQHNRKTARLSPDYTFAIRELGCGLGTRLLGCAVAKSTITIGACELFPILVTYLRLLYNSSLQLEVSSGP